MDYILIDTQTGKEFEVAAKVIAVLDDPYYMQPRVDDGIRDADNAGLLGLPDETPEYLQVWAHEGFNNHTSVDAVLGDQHAGAMLCAGFAMMECDDE